MFFWWDTLLEILSKMTRVGVADVTLNGTEKAVYAILRQNSESSRERIAEKVSELQIIYIVPMRTRNKIMQRRLPNETRKHQILDC